MWESQYMLHLIIICHAEQTTTGRDTSSALWTLFRRLEDFPNILNNLWNCLCLLPPHTHTFIMSHFSWWSVSLYFKGFFTHTYLLSLDATLVKILKMLVSAAELALTEWIHESTHSLESSTFHSLISSCYHGTKFH